MSVQSRGSMMVYGVSVYKSLQNGRQNMRKENMKEVGSFRRHDFEISLLKMNHEMIVRQLNGIEWLIACS